MGENKEETTTEIVTLRVQHVEPGIAVHYPLTYFKCFPEDLDSVDWGLCEHDYDFWIGGQGSIDGESILRLTAFDVFERRDEEYPDWGDEELFVRVEPKSGGGFGWCLLNKEECAAIMEKYKDFPQT